MAKLKHPQRKGCFRAGLRFAFAIVILLLVIIGGLSLWQAWSSTRESHQYPPPGQLYQVGGLHLHLNCMGTGSPTILLESGLGGPSTMWARVQPELARQYRVCSYDRAGLGWSSPSPEPRTAQRIAGELRSLLRAADIPGPYVLTGHSFGGYIVRIYASRYPDEVKGMILVGAGHEDFYRRIPSGCEAIAQATTSFGKLAFPLTQLGLIRLAGNAGLLNPILGEMLDKVPSDVRSELLAQTFYQPQYWQTYIAEMTSIPESEQEVRSTGNLGKLPLVVVSGNPDVGRVPASCRASDVIALSKELQVALVHLSSRGEQIVCDTCGHYIPLTDPQLVVDAVTQLLKGPGWQDGE